ncbi:MAG TPA: hypothetical protein VMT70_17050, partial [Vicinamibacteria bacterium]|nr:hypothetical protein [Vicinamibacteria bacterium]
MRRSWALRTLCALAFAFVFVAATRGQTPPRPVEPNNLGDTALDLVYTPVTPCRIIDTRLAGGPIPANTTRDFKVTGDTTSQGGANCGIPSGVTAAMINFAAVSPAGAGNLRITPYGQAIPLAAIITYSAGVSISNGLAVAICDPSG